ncbi:hypothetical protein C0991_010511 [Blastosporella zonata]|nr:hypothetical protein C0991_010511 [Blastosporella zonata]
MSFKAVTSLDCAPPGSNHTVMTAVQEPLLHDTQSTSNDAHEPPKPKRTPLPMFQLFIVLLIQFAEPITATVIYPFINQFVRDTGVIEGDERKTGYYAGAIASRVLSLDRANLVDRIVSLP